MKSFGAVIAVVCMALIVICIIAAASFANGADYKNQTDTFGKAHSAQENATADTLKTASGGMERISSAMMVFAAAILLILIIIAALVLTKQPRW